MKSSHFWLFAFLAQFAGFASAAGLGDITAAVDFSAVDTAIIAIAVIVAAVLVTRRGAGMVLGAIKGR